ncbi:MAG: Ig-like domain-containing protein [Mobilitalea sp.]
MRFRKQMTALSLIMLIFIMDLFGVSDVYIMKSKAATFDEINHPDVFLKQVNGDLQCTLVATTMLVRRAAMLSGNLNWANITIDQIKQQAWIDGVGLKYTFTYEGITVSKAPFGSDPVNEALALLQQHPEGIVLYDQIRIPRAHAVLLTDYTNEMFYCADPSDAVPYGRIPINAGLVQVKDTEYYYYVSSPSIPSPASSGTEGNVILPVTDINTYGAELSQTDYYYDGNEKKPVISITGLVENVDYTVSYFNNVNLGKAAVIISGIGMYSGVMIKDFGIREATLYDYINEIKVGITKQTIQKGKTTTLKVDLPQTLTLVKEYSNSNNLPSINNEVKISYKSANSKIAIVNSKGKITGKKKGNTKITVTAALADGTKKVVTLTIKVK